MKNSRKGIIVYVIIAFGVAWGIWGILFASGISPRHPDFQLWGTLPGFAPALAAIIVRKWITREGFSDAALRPNFKRWRFYLTAWLLPLGVAAVIIGLAVIFRISTPDPTLQRAYQILAPLDGPPKLLLTLPLPILPMLITLLTTLLIWGEEFGWRGYLQLRLFPDRPVRAAAVTGLIWAAWHIPLILASGDQYGDTPLEGLLVFPITGMLLAVIWGWFRLKTGSIWGACLAHAATNSLGSLMLISLFYGGPHWTWVSYFGILGWLPLGLISAAIIFSGQLTQTAKTDR